MKKPRAIFNFPNRKPRLPTSGGRLQQSLSVFEELRPRDYRVRAAPYARRHIPRRNSAVNLYPEGKLRFSPHFRKRRDFIERNRIKRQLRHAAAELLPLFLPDCDYVFVVRQAAAQLTYAQLRAEMARAVEALAPGKSSPGRRRPSSSGKHPSDR